MTQMTRRDFLATGAAAGAALATGPAFAAKTKTDKDRPNILLIITDQQGVDTISAGGWGLASTPNLDRLARRGVMFTQSYSSNPVCSPARSSIYTGRTSCETGVYKNGLPIRSGIPNLGQIFSAAGYDTVYCGKWHVPQSATWNISGFRVLPGMLGGQGTLCDEAISSASEAYLRNRRGDKPFLLAVNFLQPHDVCNWVFRHKKKLEKLPFPEIAGELPSLPPNHAIPGEEPKPPNRTHTTEWTELQWRYYIWSYHRMVEEVDAEIGRVLNALEDSGQAENTVVIFTSDHGEGRGRHRTTQKNFLYDEASKVPFIISWPGELPEGRIDKETLVSGLDVVATACDCAGIDGPKVNRGISVRPIAAGRKGLRHDFVVSEVLGDSGRMLRTPDYKLIAFRTSPIRQLFDVKNDPGETKNLANDAKYADVLRDHCKLLNTWEAGLERAPTVPGETFRV